MRLRFASKKHSLPSRNAWRKRSKRRWKRSMLVSSWQRWRRHSGNWRRFRGSRKNLRRSSGCWSRHRRRKSRGSGRIWRHRSRGYGRRSSSGDRILRRR